MGFRRWPKSRHQQQHHHQQQQQKMGIDRLAACSTARERPIQSQDAKTVDRLILDSTHIPKGKSLPKVIIKTLKLKQGKEILSKARHHRSPSHSANISALSLQYKVSKLKSSANNLRQQPDRTSHYEQVIHTSSNRACSRILHPNRMQCQMSHISWG